MFLEVIIITTKEVQKMMSTDPKMKREIKMKMEVVCVPEDGDMGTADALRHIQQKIKVCSLFTAYLFFGKQKICNYRIFRFLLFEMSPFCVFPMFTANLNQTKTDGIFPFFLTCVLLNFSFFQILSWFIKQQPAWI